MISTHKPYTLLICNGEMAAPEVVRQLAGQAESILCADGGANAAHALGILPDVVVGDFDSITEDTRSFYAKRGVQMMHISRQDDTDLEKALKLLRERGESRIVLLGLTGKLLDHTLGNFSILLRYTDSMQIVAFDPHFRVDVLASGGSFRSRAGDRVSIVPLPAAEGLRYEGLRYPLDTGVLSFGLREGTCNEATTDRFSVSFSTGTILLFRQLFPRLSTHPFDDE